MGSIARIPTCRWTVAVIDRTRRGLLA
jgi:hypothetical protein